MRFIKAKDRLPDKPGSYFCREISTGRKYVYWFSSSRQSMFYRRAWDIEWLDCEAELQIDASVKLIKAVFNATSNALIEYNNQTDYQ